MFKQSCLRVCQAPDTVRKQNDGEKDAEEGGEEGGKSRAEGGSNTEPWKRQKGRLGAVPLSHTTSMLVLSTFAFSYRKNGELAISSAPSSTWRTHPPSPSANTPHRHNNSPEPLQPSPLHCQTPPYTFYPFPRLPMPCWSPSSPHQPAPPPASPARPRPLPGRAEVRRAPISSPSACQAPGSGAGGEFAVLPPRGCVIRRGRLLRAVATTLAARKTAC